MSSEVTAHRATLRDVVPSASDSLEMDSQSILELLSAAGRVDRVSTACPEESGTRSLVSRFPAND